MSEPFRVVLADPPWPYRDGLTMSSVKRGAASNYRTLSIDEICNLYTPSRVNGKMTYAPGKLAGHPIAADAHLYLWTTNAFVVEAHEVAQRWGFVPKTLLTWVKPRIGMGHYYRNTTEHVIFAVRGKLATLRKDQPTHFEAPVGRHSEKPQEFYRIVEALSPGPYLELFARAPRDGWTSWGNEMPPAHAEEEPPLPLESIADAYAAADAADLDDGRRMRRTRAKLTIAVEECLALFRKLNSPDDDAKTNHKRAMLLNAAIQCLSAREQKAYYAAIKSIRDERHAARVTAKDVPSQQDVLPEPPVSWS